jgi:hypothetical protein
MTVSGSMMVERMVSTFMMSLVRLATTERYVHPEIGATHRALEAHARSWLRAQRDVRGGRHALAGHLAEAQKQGARLRQHDPQLRISNLDDVMAPFRRAEDRAKYEQGLRIAGLPE